MVHGLETNKMLGTANFLRHQNKLILDVARNALVP